VADPSRRLLYPAGVTTAWVRRRIPLLIAVLGLQAAQAAAPDVDALRQSYAGEYEFVGGSAERSAVPAAVERSVDGMFFIARGIAYDRLLKSSQVCDRYTIDFGGGRVSVAGSCRT